MRNKVNYFNNQGLSSKIIGDVFTAYWDFNFKNP